MAFQELSKKNFKYFNGTAISTSFVLPVAAVYPVILIVINDFYFNVLMIVILIIMQSVNGAQFLNITPLTLSSNRLVASSAPAPVIAIVPLTSIYASL